jgi:DNA polymerase I
MNPLLFGHDDEQCIVAVQQKNDNTMRVYLRLPDGVQAEDRPFYPFFFLTDNRLISGYPKKHWVRRLDGTGSLRYLCVFEEWPVLWDAVRYVLEEHNRSAVAKVDSYQDLNSLYLVTDPAAQYLLQSGKTLFKGMSFGELVRMQLDIETFTTPGHRFSNASRPGDRIMVIGMSDNTGWHEVVGGRKKTEEDILREMIRIIAERDPDVIEGHNIFNFDLSYILTRCGLYDITPAIGREGGVPRLFDTRTSFAEHTFEYVVVDIPGRHVIDTLLLVQNYDAVKRSMENYGLKYAAQYFGLTAPDRTVIPGEKISWYWEHDLKTLMKYVAEDVAEVGALSEHLSATPFYLAQMLPYSFGTVARMGAAAKIESLLTREYLRQKHTLPQPGEGMQTTGGYTDIFVTGVLGPVVHADVESLYPSIMLRNAIAPSSDELGVFLRLLKDLTSMRLERKREMQRAKDPVDRSRLDAMQSSLKILINSFYGYLGYSRALFNDFFRADEVTQTGQQILRTMMAEIRRTGGSVIEVDTDGIYFVPPETIGSETAERKYVADLAGKLPEGISVAMAGRYRKMLSYKRKNYALLEYDGKIRIKGSSLVSRSMEQFGRSFVHHAIDLVLNGDIEGLHQHYLRYRRAIMEHHLKVSDFARTEALRDSIAVYEEEVLAGKRNRSAAYEVAKDSPRQVRAGDRVSYYITGTDAGVRASENCKAAEEWDPNFPDENVQYYLRRLGEFAEKFKDFFQPGDFRSVFSVDDLFPFDATKVSLRVAEMTPEEEGEEEEQRGSTFGIWLDEE